MPLFDYSTTRIRSKRSEGPVESGAPVAFTSAARDGVATAPYRRLPNRRGADAEEQSACASLSVPWHLRPIVEPTSTNSLFRTLSSKYLWWKLLYAFRMTAVAMLPIASLIAADSTGSAFVSKAFATSGALISARETLGGSIDATWAWLKCIPLTIPLLTLFTYVDLFDSPYAWGAVYVGMLTLCAFMCEGLTKRLALLVTSVTMVGQMRARYDGHGLGADLTFPVRLAAEYTLGCAFGILCTLLPWPRLASTRVDKKLTEASRNISLCFSGLCDTFWTSSNMQRRINMTRIQFAKKTALANLQDAHHCLDICRFEPQTHECYYLRLTKSELLGSFIPMIDSTLRLLEAIADDPQLLTSDPSSASFGEYMKGPLEELATSVDTALFLTARAVTLGRDVEGYDGDIEVAGGSSGVSNETSLEAAMRRVRVALLRMEASYARARRDIFYNSNSGAVVVSPPLTLPEEEPVPSEGQANTATPTSTLVQGRRKSAVHQRSGSAVMPPVLSPVAAAAGFTSGEACGEAIGNSCEFPHRTRDLASAAQPSASRNITPTAAFPSGNSIARVGGGGGSGGDAAAISSPVDPSAAGADSYTMSATAQDFAALMSYYMFTLALFGKRVVMFNRLADDKLSASRHWIFSFWKDDVVGSFVSSVLYYRDLAAFCIPLTCFLPAHHPKEGPAASSDAAAGVGPRNGTSHRHGVVRGGIKRGGKVLTTSVSSLSIVPHAKRVYAAMKLREAFKVSIAMGLCMLFYYYTDREYAFHTGGPGIVAFIVANTSSEALSGSLIRMFGTLFGGVIGFFCARITETTTEKVGALMALMFISGFFRTGKQYGTAAVYGCFVIVPMLQPNVASDEAISRIMQITFAAIIYSSISAIVFPARPQTELQKARSESVLALSKSLEAVLKCLASPFPPPPQLRRRDVLVSGKKETDRHANDSRRPVGDGGSDDPDAARRRDVIVSRESCDNASIGATLGATQNQQRSQTFHHFHNLNSANTNSAPKQSLSGGVMRNQSFRRVVVDGQAVLLEDGAAPNINSSFVLAPLGASPPSGLKRLPSMRGAAMTTTLGSARNNPLGGGDVSGSVGASSLTAANDSIATASPSPPRPNAPNDNERIGEQRLDGCEGVNFSEEEEEDEDEAAYEALLAEEEYDLWEVEEEDWDAVIFSAHLDFQHDSQTGQTKKQRSSDRRRSKKNDARSKVGGNSPDEESSAAVTIDETAAPGVTSSSSASVSFGAEDGADNQSLPKSSKLHQDPSSPARVPDVAFAPMAAVTAVHVDRATIRDAPTRIAIRHDPLIAQAEANASVLSSAIAKAAEWMPFAETEPSLTRVPYPTTLSKDLHTSLLKMRSLADLMLEALKAVRMRPSFNSPSPIFLAVVEDLRYVAIDCSRQAFFVTDMVIVSLIRRHAMLANEMVAAALLFEEKCVELHAIKALGFQQVVKLGRMVSDVIQKACSRKREEWREQRGAEKFRQRSQRYQQRQDSGKLTEADRRRWEEEVQREEARVRAAQRCKQLNAEQQRLQEKKDALLMRSYINGRFPGAVFEWSDDQLSALARAMVKEVVDTKNALDAPAPASDTHSPAGNEGGLTNFTSTMPITLLSNPNLFGSIAFSRSCGGIGGGNAKLLLASPKGEATSANAGTTPATPFNLYKTLQLKNAEEEADESRRGGSEEMKAVAASSVAAAAAVPPTTPSAGRRRLKLLMSNADALGMHTITLSLVIFAKELKRLVTSVDGLQQHMLTVS